MAKKKPNVPRSETIELDTLFSLPTLGTGTEEQNSQIKAFFKSGEWSEEHYLVRGIRKHLLTEDQRKKLFDLDKSIEDMLNGRYGEAEEAAIGQIYADWNFKLGFKCFGR